jgi:hypothetical protein
MLNKTKLIILILIVILILILILFLIYHRSIIIQSYETKYNFVIGAAFKNESHILDEWILHYKHHGADHIYLINDGSTDDFQSVLKPYIENGYVTLFNNTLEIADYPRQKYLYETYFRPILSQSKWWSIIDLDEFMYSPEDINLQNIINRYNNYNQLFARWRMFGSNGHINQPKYVVQSFTKRKGNNDNVNGKTIFKSDMLVEFDVHFHKMKEGELKFVHDIIINHYAIQSLSFFKAVKMTRGDVNNYQYAVRDLAYFNSYDFKDVDDFVLMEQNNILFL